MGRTSWSKRALTRTSAAMWSSARALTCALGLMAGCGDDEQTTRADAGSGDGAVLARDGGGSVDASGMDAAGASVAKGKVRGRVTYADGTAVGQVDVRIAGKLVRSDNRGVFAADDVDEGEHEIAIADARASAAQVRVNVRREQLSQTELFVLPLKRVGVTTAETGGDISDTGNPDQVKVRLPASGLRRAGSGATVTGAVDARYAAIKSATDVRAVPGRLRAVMANQEVDLESYGAIDLRFVQNEEELQLAADADLELPLGPNSFADQSEIDSWSFDPPTGRWRLEGKAKIDKSSGGNGIARVKLTHLSWWTVAQPVAAQTCVSGKLLSDSQQPLANVFVGATGSDYWGSFGQYTDEQGQFCLNVKQGSSNTLSAFGLYGTSYFEWKQDISAGSTAALCGAAGCTDLGAIAGSSLFDECTGDVTHDQNQVLVLSSGDQALDGTLEQMLEHYDHVVTVGVPYHQFDGTLDLSPYDAIYLQANSNWGVGDMPAPGQRQLINWVNCGGGLVTSEWTTWKIGSDTFKLIDAIFPAARTREYSSPQTETYTKVSAEPAVNAGLPDSFTFNTTNYAGTESHLTPRQGALTFYDAMTSMHAGLLGWPYNLGRVATFSTTVGVNEIGDANFGRLLANTLDWVQRDPASSKPPPTAPDASTATEPDASIPSEPDASIPSEPDASTPVDLDAATTTTTTSTLTAN